MSKIIERILKLIFPKTISGILTTNYFCGWESGYDDGYENGKEDGYKKGWIIILEKHNK